MSGNPFSLEGKTILVTGASSGLGRQTAVSCSRMGATAIISGRDAARLEETRAMRVPGAHKAVQADLTIQEHIDELVARAGRIDGVFHGAGVRGLSPIKLISKKFLDEVFGINYYAPMLLTQRLLFRNAIRDGGSIVFMASTAAHRGVVGVGVYSGTKGALIATVRCLALEQGKRGIRANCISADLVETPLLTYGLTEEEGRNWLQQQRDKHPLGLGTPDDVANAAIYLFSDASRWVTGATIVMDGGVTF
jgi:NAD(P)-dependent dehydrogenase (short-subunit alcohol dehydrogenase family)